MIRIELQEKTMSKIYNVVSVSFVEDSSEPGVKFPFVSTFSFVSGSQAHQKRHELKALNPQDDIFVQEVLIQDASESHFLSLQRQLGKLQSRLGKARKSLREKKDVINQLLGAMEARFEDGIFVGMDSNSPDEDGDTING